MRCCISALVRFLLFAVLPVCLSVALPAFKPALIAEAATDAAPPAPAVVSTVTSTAPDAAKPADAGQARDSGAAGLVSGGTTTPEQATTFVDVVHAELSHTIQGTATWMDSFFGDRRYRSELNESYVRFRYNTFFEQGSPSLLKPDLEVRIVLPQLREKTHLILAGTPKETPDFSAVQAGVAPEQTTTSDLQGGAAAAVDRTFLETAEQHFTTRAGLKLHNFKPVVLLSPRYRLLIPIGRWNFRFIEELGWTSNVGFANHATIDIERPLPKGLFFRATDDWYHTEHQKGSLYAVAFVLGQPLSSRRAIMYEWANIFQTEPVHELTEVDLRVRYRQRIWRDWLWFEVAPQYRFPRVRHFKATPGILFRIEMTVGRYER